MHNVLQYEVIIISNRLKPPAMLGELMVYFLRENRKLLAAREPIFVSITLSDQKSGFFLCSLYNFAII